MLEVLQQTHTRTQLGAYIKVNSVFKDVFKEFPKSFRTSVYSNIVLFLALISMSSGLIFAFVI